jgi:hypothetical protein
MLVWVRERSAEQVRRLFGDVLAYQYPKLSVASRWNTFRANLLHSLLVTVYQGVMGRERSVGSPSEFSELTDFRSAEPLCSK